MSAAGLGSRKEQTGLDRALAGPEGPVHAAPGRVAEDLAASRLTVGEDTGTRLRAVTRTRVRGVSRRF